MMASRSLYLMLLGLVALPAAVIPCAAPARDPMLATVYEGGVDVSEYWISEKLDGVRGRWDGRTLRSRTGYVINAPAWFTERWPDVPMDGELWMARGRFDQVSGIVRAVEPDHAAWRKVRFMVFDLPAHPGRWEVRAEAIRSLLSDTEVGHTDGQGKYLGMLGALVVERPDGLRFRLGSGFTDAERASPPPIGSWVTYRYSGLTPNGVPRFARFVRIRGDTPRRAHGEAGVAADSSAVQNPLVQ